MLSIAWPLIKAFAPWLLIIAAFGATYFAGVVVTREEYIARESAKDAIYSATYKAALERNAVIRKNLTTATQHIEATANANRSIIDNLYADNLARAKRLQFSTGCRRDATDRDTGATGNSNAATAGTGVFFEELAESARQADQLTETARACQSYIFKLREEMNK